MARSPERAPLLPKAAVEGIKRSLTSLAGLLIALVAAGAGLALFTYHPSDPSFNTVGGGEAMNALGSPGAYFADFAVQALGLAGVLPLAALGLWGLRLAIQQPTARVWLRAVGVVVATVLVAPFLDVVPRSPGWRAEVGLGGWIGYFLRDAIGAFILFSGAFGPNGAIRFLTPGAVKGLLVTLCGAGGAALFLASLSIFRTTCDLSVFAGRVVAAFVAGQVARARGRPVLSVTERVRTPLRRRRAKPEKGPASKKVPLSKADARRASRQASGGLEGKPLVIETGPPELVIALPPLALLKPDRPRPMDGFDIAALGARARALEGVFAAFGADGEVVDVRAGPIVTVFEFRPRPGVRLSRIVGLADDVAGGMNAASARISVLPGDASLGVEVVNDALGDVRLHDIVAAPDFRSFEGELPMVLGRDVGGGSVIDDLARMPNLLIGGGPGSGKSTALRAMIVSLLYRFSPREVRFVLFDRGMKDLTVFDGVPHLLAPVFAEAPKAVYALRWLVGEMEERLRAMNTIGARTIDVYNSKVRAAKAQGRPLTRTVQTGFGPDGAPLFEEQVIESQPLPYVVFVFDEFAGLMETAPKETESVLQRLTQTSRAAGINLIMASGVLKPQVFTGPLRGGFASKAAFRTDSKIASRTILGLVGAEQLLSAGDMLYVPPGARPKRVHTPQITDAEAIKVSAYLRSQADPQYLESITRSDGQGAPGADTPTVAGVFSAEDDALYAQAVAAVLRERRVSVSLVQRHLKIGYARAGALVARMENDGVVSGPDHTGRRELLRFSADPG